MTTGTALLAGIVIGLIIAGFAVPIINHFKQKREYKKYSKGTGMTQMKITYYKDGKIL